jgi:hypothetical protein
MFNTIIDIRRDLQFCFISSYEILLYTQFTLLLLLVTTRLANLFLAAGPCPEQMLCGKLFVGKFNKQMIRLG